MKTLIALVGLPLPKGAGCSTYVKKKTTQHSGAGCYNYTKVNNNNGKHILTASQSWDKMIPNKTQYRKGEEL